MKKLAFLLASALVVFAACKKSSVSEKPKWTTSPLNKVELGENVEGKVSSDDPVGVKSFTVSLESLPVELIGLVNSAIGLSANKASATKAGVLDLVNDSKFASSSYAKFFTPVGASLAGATSVTLDLGGFIMSLMEGNDLATGTLYELSLSMMDNDGNPLTQKASFKWTAAPKITTSIKANPAFFGEGMDPFKVMVEAPGALAGLTIAFEGEAGKNPLSGVMNYSKTYSPSGVLDLINQTDASANALSLPESSKLKDKKSQVVIDMSTLMSNLVVWNKGVEGSFVLNITAEDKLGKSSTYQQIFRTTL